MTDFYDRDLAPLPDDWYDKTKYPNRPRGKTERRLAHTVIGDTIVSTVWLGLDHANLDGGSPIIFETMTFGAWNCLLARYHTEEEALRGHLAVLDRLRAGKPPFAYLDKDGEQ